ncbi:50S ribosomal protein L9 [Candidatus Peregrinibacteria bacterium]|nr:50S ribosomal protein L9 [Candidatus Peregrinibacteria bacterium]
MQIVLNKDVPKLGYRGEVVKVREGYFRNFLLPRGLALIATPSFLKLAAVRKEKIVEARKKVVENAKDILSKLKGLKLNLKAKISSKGKLFGAIGEDKIVEAIEKATDLKLDKGFVKMTHIKTTGSHDVIIHLGPDMEEKVKVTVKAL